MNLTLIINLEIILRQVRFRELNLHYYLFMPKLNSQNLTAQHIQ